jgi:hypothetical protein
MANGCLEAVGGTVLFWVLGAFNSDAVLIEKFRRFTEEAKNVP